MSLNSFTAGLYNRLDANMKEIVRGSLLVFTLKIAGVGTNFGVNVVIARVLGADRAGVYYLALMVATIASVIGRVNRTNGPVESSGSVIDGAEKGKGFTDYSKH